MRSMTQEERWILEKYNGERTEGFFADLERLKAGEPLAFILGSIPFLGTTIYLDSKPLIPRVETEYWVSKAIEEIHKSPASVKVLDLCAGSGCIGVAVGKAFPNATIHFAEIDTAHHPTILKNIRQNDLISETAIFGGSLFEQITERYHAILCNPPYIADESPHVQESVKKYEPPLALYGGKDGTDLIAQIIEEAPKHLYPHGLLFIEHEPEQVAQLQAYAHKHSFTITTHNDQYGVPRYSELRMAQ